MNILSKFENLELKQEDKIPKEDKEHCEKIQSIYENTLSVYKKWYEIYHEAKLQPIQSHDFYGLEIKNLKICETIKNLHSDLIYQIYNYFESKYKLKLEKINTDKLNFNYDYYKNTINTEPLNYKVYVGNILKQLEGLSFENMRIRQLKEELKSICQNSYTEEWNIEIKGKTVKFNDLIYWIKRKWDDGYHITSNYNFLKVESALGWFEYKKEIKFKEFDQFRDRYNTQWYTIDDNMKINAQKIDSVKVFKNGRVDIKFSSPEIAREFITQWCGYPLNKIA